MNILGKARIEGISPNLMKVMYQIQKLTSDGETLISIEIMTTKILSAITIV
jgi:hypothetical protein